MAETTGIPIIDRLDALLAEGAKAERNARNGPADTAWFDYQMHAIGSLNDLRDLRAELLRLQEEGRSARAQVQDAVDEVERLREERDYAQADRETAEQQRDVAERDRDALLEALKRFVDVPPPECMTAEELCVDCGRKISILDHADDCDWVKHIRARENAQRAIANVEGKHGGGVTSWGTDSASARGEPE